MHGGVPWGNCGGTDEGPLLFMEGERKTQIQTRRGNLTSRDLKNFETKSSLKAEFDRKREGEQENAFPLAYKFSLWKNVWGKKTRNVVGTLLNLKNKQTKKRLKCKIKKITTNSGHNWLLKVLQTKGD